MNRTYPARVMQAGAFLALCFVTSFAQTPTLLDDEIVKLRKDLAATQLDCQRTGEEIQKDRKDNDAYEKRAAGRMAQARRQLDTLASETRNQSRLNDSLAAVITAIQSRRRQIELSQDDFRKRLVALCNGVLPETRRLPPLVLSPAHSALSLLISDLNAGSIDNNEGFSRLAQILAQFDDAASSIQISQETSPVAEIRGTAYRLRVGTFFEAVVDAKGEQCALFEGWNADGSPRWKLEKASIAAREILDAVNIREGKKLPAFVSLPFVPGTDSTAAAPSKGGDR